MGLYDYIWLPQDIKLPKFPGNPRFQVLENGKEVKRRWSTKDLLCAQDLYRIVKIDDPNRDVEVLYQLERRVPPLEETTQEGNWIHNENEDCVKLCWWNVIRWSGDMKILEYHNPTDSRYEYYIDVSNGVFSPDDIYLKCVEKDHRPDTYLDLNTDDLTIKDKNISIKEVVEPIIDGENWRDVLDKYDDLKLIELKQAWRYAGRSFTPEIIDGWDWNSDDYQKIRYQMVKQLNFNNMSEYEKEKHGITDGWEDAKPSSSK